ncbi:MAG TPA: enoyl-CoA hydratase [Acidimicrobiales bacterium]|jgi:enoyl-CoA hydratase
MTLVDVELGTRAPGVALVTINDPDRRNALTPPMIDELVAAFDTLEADASAGAVILTGAPPAFCAGADLSHLGGSPSDSGLRGIYEGFLRVGRSPLPTIAAVNGAAVGAGINLALCCDVRLAGRRARFDTRFLQLGLHPGGGNTWMMRRVVGPQGTAAAVIFGEVLDGPEAERSGLVWRCVDDDALIDTAVQMAARAAAVPTSLARRAKATIATMAAVASHEEAVDVELEAQLWSMAQPEFAERLEAMRKKIGAR